MIIVTESAAAALEGFIAKTGLSDSARLMVLRVLLAFMGHRGRMSSSQAAGRELQYLADRLQTPGGIAKLKRLLAAATPPEFRTAT